MAKFFRILSIDGGGIRGVIPAQVLVELEQKLREKGSANARISDYFDLIAGTSTGGILTCIYRAPADDGSGRPRTARRALDLYLDHGDEIFHIPTAHRIRTVSGLSDEKYPAQGLETALETYLGDLELRDLLGPCLIPAYEIRRRRTWFFTQHDAGDPERNFLVRDVARATSAAPTYFEAAQIFSMAGRPYALVDGGVFANNPALCAYAEARQMQHPSDAKLRPTAKHMVILSLGTGEVKAPYHHSQAKDWGLAGWAKPILDIMMSGVAETVDFELRQIYDAVGCPDQYLRIQPRLRSDNAALDDADPENLETLRLVGEEAARDYDAGLDAIVSKLLDGVRVQ